MKDHLKIVAYSVVSLLIAGGIAYGVSTIARTAYDAKKLGEQNRAEIVQIANFINAQIQATQQQQQKQQDQ